MHTHGSASLLLYFSFGEVPLLWQHIVVLMMNLGNYDDITYSALQRRIHPTGAVGPVIGIVIGLLC